MLTLARPTVTDALEATLWQWVILAVVAGLLVSLVLWIKAVWFGDDDTAQQDHSMLSEITELQRRGELSDSEYRSIKGRLTTRLDFHDQESSSRGTSSDS